MSRFIKLSNLIVNTSKIVKIETYADSHYMYMVNTRIEGFFLFSSGFIDSEDHIIKICKNKHPIDYEIVKEWIKKL